MRSRNRALILGCFLATALSGIVQPQVQAQSGTENPFVVVSIGRLDKTMPNIRYILKAAGVPEFGGLAELMVNQYSQGLDKTRPAGVMVSMVDAMPAPVGFLPLTDREQLFAVLEPQFGEPDDLGDGLYGIAAGPQTLYVREQGAWLFVANNEELLTNLPADPQAALGKMDQIYDLGIRLSVQDIPQDMKDMAMGQMRGALERSLAEQSENQTEEEQAAAEAMSMQSLEQVERALTEMDQLIIGWASDPVGQKTFLDMRIVAKEGTEMAKEMDAYKGMTSDFNAFIMDDAAMNLRTTSLMSGATQEQVLNSVAQLKKQALDQIADSGDLDTPAKREAASEIVGDLVDLLSDTVKAGKIDGGAVLSVSDAQLKMVVGGFIADGNELATQAKKLADAAKEDPNFPKINFDAEKYKGVTFHTALVPLKTDSEEAIKVFGEELPIVIGTADKAFYLGFGTGCTDLLKSVLDKKEATGATAVKPMEMTLHVGQLLAFAQSISPQPALEMMLDTFREADGKDRIMIQTETLPRGQVYRFAIEESVLRAIGTAAKSGNAVNADF